MKKVLYVTHGHPDFSPGGGELAALFLYEAMRRGDKYDSYMLARLDQPNIQKPGCQLALHESDDHVSFLITPPAACDHFLETYIFSDANNAQIHFPFKELVLALKPDIIHFQHYIHLGVDLIPYAKVLLPDVRIVVTLHEYCAICHNQGLMIRIGTNELCHRAYFAQCSRCFPDRHPSEFFVRERNFKSNFAVVDKFIAPSNFLRNRYIEWGIEPERIIYLDNGRPIWPEPQRPAKREGEPFVAGFFGQIVRLKGLTVFLEAAAEYLRLRAKGQAEGNGSRSLPEIRFAVHGLKRDLPDDMERKISELTGETSDILRFHGPYQQPELPELLLGIDCLVLPSIWWENSPLVIQEAFMSRVPIICSNIGGMAEKVEDRINGLHFRVGDHFDLLNKLIELAESPDLYKKLEAGIPEIISDSEMAKRVEEIYEAIL